MAKRAKIIGISSVISLVMLLLLIGACQSAPAPATASPKAPAPTSAPATTPKPAVSSPAATPKPTAAAAVKEILIGDLADYSGPTKGFCSSQQRGMQLAIEEINAAGGIKALGGAKLKLVTVDHQYQPDLAKQGAERLLYEQKVQVLTLGTPSGFGVMVGKIAQAANAPFYPMSVGTTAMLEQGFKNMFRLGTWSMAQGRAAIQDVDKLAEKYFAKKPTKWAVMYVDSEYGQDEFKGMKDEAAVKGYQMVAELPYPLGLKDPTPFVAKAKAANPDLFAITALGQEAYSIPRTMADMGWYPLTIGFHSSSADYSFIQNLGPASENRLAANMGARGAGKDSNAFADKYVAKYNFEPDGFAFLGGQYIYTIAAVIQQAGSADWQAIINASRKLVYTTDTGPMVGPYTKIQFDEKGQVPVEYWSAPIVQVQNGKWLSLWPESPGVTMKFPPEWKDWQKK